MPHSVPFRQLAEEILRSRPHIYQFLSRLREEAEKSLVCWVFREPSSAISKIEYPLPVRIHCVRLCNWDCSFSGLLSSGRAPAGVDGGSQLPETGLAPQSV